MKLYAGQLDIVWEDPPRNFARLRAMLEDAALIGPGLLVLPEMFATGFSMNVAAVADHDGRTRAFLAGLAQEFGLHIIAGLVTPGTNGRGRNQALCLGPDGRVLACYTKMQPFTFAGEHEHYERGRAPLVFPCGEYCVAPLICYDLRFPELFRAVARQTHVFTVIANFPRARAADWRALLVARAIENQAYVVGVNRCGADPTLEYAGDSLIIGPRGEILAAAGDHQGLIGAEADLSALLDFRRAFPALEDMNGKWQFGGGNGANGSHH